MTEQVRYRIERSLVKQAEKVCGDLGMTPTQAVSMFFAQLVKLGALPFRPSNFPALQEYEATDSQGKAAEAEARAELDRDETAGKLVRFKGKLA